MSYQIEQKIGKNIYFYEVDSYWDPVRKQARQKRRYIGKKDPATGQPVTPRKSVFPRAARDFGAIYLLKKMSELCDLPRILESAFGEDAGDLLNLAMFQLIEGKPFYLFKSWLEGSYIDSYSLASSQEISQFCLEIGKRDHDRQKFLDVWACGLPASRAVVFDITSLSSHGKLIDLLEWGYNRDVESLPQINLGVSMRVPDGIPVSYSIYPGSINDVSTLSNLITELKSRRMSISRFVLDRGFYSSRNITQMIREKIPFLMPLPAHTQLASQLLSETKTDLMSAVNGFVHQGQTLFHVMRRVKLNDSPCDAHVYLDQERKAREMNTLVRRVTEVEEWISREEYLSLHEVLQAIDEKAPALKKLWDIRLVDGKAVLARKKNSLSIRANRFGKHIILSKSSRLSREEVVWLYRRKDMVEKLFDVLKNELDSNRPRIHSREALEGRLFITFLSILLYFLVLSKMKNNEYLAQFSIPEILAKLRILRVVEMNNGKAYLTEITKKQRLIFDAFNIPLPEKPSY